MTDHGPDAAESRAAEAILLKLQALAPLSSRRLDQEQIEADSLLARLDGRFASSHSVSGLLRQSLAAATDNMQALRRLIFVEEAGRPVSYREFTRAPYSLVRTIIECSATVLWALLPDDPREGARRSLVLIAREVFNAASFWEDYLRETDAGRHAVVMEHFDGLRRAVNDSAHAMSLPPIFTRKADGSWGYATKNRTQTAILKDLRSADGLPRDLVYVWQFCSGYSHGLEWASADAGTYPRGLFRPGTTEPLRGVCDVAFDLLPRAVEVYDLRRRAWPAC